MADFTRSVELIFGGKDNVSPTIKSITRSLDDFDKRVQSSAQPLGNLADSILKVDAAVVAIGATMLAFSVGEAIRFESAQLDLQKVLGESEGSVDLYKDTIKELSLEYGVLATDTTASVAEFKQANFTIEESLQLVEGALIAVQISELDAAESSELLKRTLKGFGIEAEDVVSVLDTWNQASNNFNTNTREIATGLSELAPIADQVGLSLDETAALLIPIIERFGSGTEASKALRTALLSMVSPTANVVDVLDSMGISQRDANGEIRNAADILRDVQVAYTSLNDKQQFFNTGLLVGKNQAARLTPVLAGLNLTLEAQAVLDEKAGSTMDELAVRMQATELSVNRLKTAFNVAQESIGVNFLEGVKGSSNELTNLLIAISDVVDSGGLAPLFNLMQPMFVEFEKDIAAIAKNLPEAFANIDFSGLIDAFGGLGSELSDILTGLFGDFDIETVEGLQAVLQGTVEGLTALVNVTRGIFIELQVVFDAIGTVIQSAGSVGEDTEIAFGRFLGAGKLITDFGTSMGAALLIIDNTGTDIKNVFDVIIGTARVGINSLQIAFDTIALTFIELFRQLNSIASTLTFGDLSATFQANADELLIIGNAIEENLVKNAQEAAAGWRQIGEGFSVVAREVERDAGGVGTSIAGISATTADAAVQIEGAGDAMVAAWRDSGRNLLVAEDAVAGIGDAATIAGGKAADAGIKTEKWITTLVDGVPTFKQAGEGISQSFQTAETAADDAIKKTDEFILKMEELASNERIATIEANVELNIAGLEADAQVAVAIIETLGASIASTAELIGSLFGTFADAGAVEQRAILRQIDLENKNRESELRLQETLVTAQVSLLEAKTTALRDGEGLITIQADGLEPELEAFMMAVLRRVQIKAAEDQSLYLLGLPAV